MGNKTEKVEFIQNTVKDVKNIELLVEAGILKEVNVFDELAYNKENRKNEIYVFKTYHNTFASAMFSKTYSYDSDIDVIELISATSECFSFNHNDLAYKWLK